MKKGWDDRTQRVERDHRGWERRRYKSTDEMTGTAHGRKESVPPRKAKGDLEKD